VAGIVLGTWAVAVFAILWIGLVAGALGDGRVLADAWAWLDGLAPVARVVAWVLFLPAAIGLWAWNATLPAPAVIAVVAGLVAWTAVAVASLARTLRRT
jgi:hypothetical protein